METVANIALEYFHWAHFFVSLTVLLIQSVLLFKDLVHKPVKLLTSKSQYFALETCFFFLKKYKLFLHASSIDEKYKKGSKKSLYKRLAVGANFFDLFCVANKMFL